MLFDSRKKSTASYVVDGNTKEKVSILYNQKNKEIFTIRAFDSNYNGGRSFSVEGYVQDVLLPQVTEGDSEGLFMLQAVAKIVPDSIPVKCR